MYTLDDFRTFYEHPVIKSIADNEKWTVSDKDKMPVDIREFIDNGRIRGANITSDKNPLVSLSELCDTLPTATNNAYYLDCLLDNIVILDIESSCPEETKKKFLETPYLYGEVSMSGHGLHLIYQLPEIFSKYPMAQQKVAMKSEGKDYEILLNHWITFTRNMIPPATGSSTFFLDTFEDLASRQVVINRKNIDIEREKPIDIPNMDYFISIIKKMPYRKTPYDFTKKNGDPDTSAFEFGYMGFRHIQLKRLIQSLDTMNKIKNKQSHNYTDTEKAWILYAIAEDELPKREKHETYRNGLPWLLYIAKDIISRDN